MAEQRAGSGANPVASKSPRRIWSLRPGHAIHGPPDELRAIARTVAELGWLLLVAALAYTAFARHGLSPEAITAMLGGAFVYAAILVALQTFGLDPFATPWPLLGRCWAMIAFVTWLVWNAGPDRAPLSNLYHLVIIATAVAFGARATLINLALIALAVVTTALRHPDASSGTVGLALMLAPMALIAYVTSRLAADIRRAIERIRFISETDELTRLYNLRAFMHIAERLHRQARRYRRSYALVMIDSDNLKSVNDAHGHQAGNELLKLTTTCIRRELRETDVAARYGGDEFILLLPETGAQGGRELSERVRRAVADKGMEVRGMRIATSVSIGIAAFPEHGTDLRSIMNKADQAMYLSKKTGRNRVTLFDPG